MRSRDLKDREERSDVKSKRNDVSSSLQRKAEVYDRLRRCAERIGGFLYKEKYPLEFMLKAFLCIDPDKYLVDFDDKDLGDSGSASDEEGPTDGRREGLKTHVIGDDNDDLYTEYCDRFGRTRRVLKGDVEFLQHMDDALDSESSLSSSERDSRFVCSFVLI